MAQRNRRGPAPRAAADPTRSGNPAVRSGERPARTPVRRPPAPTPEPEAHPGATPRDGASYPQILRNDTYSWKLSLAGVVFGLSLYFLLVAVVSKAVVALVWSFTHPVAYRDYYTQAFSFQRPVGLLAANLGIATLIPISMVLVLVVHRTRTKWLFSVQPGVRWRYLLACLAVSVVALTAVQALSSLGGLTALAPQRHFWAFLAVVVLTSPLQAAAEEIFFRGYVLQALGSVVARPWFGVVGSAVVFALMHGTQNLPLFVNRLAFGLLAGILVWRTGGVEAGIGAHVANNLVAYLWAGLTTGIASLSAVRGTTWAESGVQIAGFAVIVAATLGVARLMRLRRRVDLARSAVSTA